MAEQILLKRALDANGDPINGAKAYFYDTGTTTPVTVYSDTGLSSAVSPPLLSDAAGRFAQTFVSSGTAVKVVYDDADDVTYLTEDPAPASTTSGSAADDISFTPTSGIPSTNVQAAIEELESDLVLSTTLLNTATNQNIGAGDRSNGYRVTGNATMSLAAAATLGAGWWFRLVADGGDITVDPNGSETVNGEASLTIPDGEAVVLLCDGAAIYAVSGGAHSNDLTFSGDNTFSGENTLSGDNTFSGDNTHTGEETFDNSKINVPPPGTCAMYAMFNPPSGWLERDGSAISRTAYADLFAAITDASQTGDTNSNTTVDNIGSTAGWGAGMYIEGAGIPVGTTIASVDSATQITLSQAATATAAGVSLRVLPWGQGDGSTSFDLPDVQGEFERGWDNGKGIDSGRVFGSSQADELKSHSHTILRTQESNSGSNRWEPSDRNGNGTDWPTSSTGGTETRPRNIAMLPIIKY